MGQINLLAVLGAAISAFVIGGLWYSPLMFHRPWMTANGFSDADLARGSTGAIFAVSFVFALVMALNLAMFLDDPSTTTAWGLAAGLLASIWVALGIGTVALFERRRWTYTAINGGYWVVALGVMGAILGTWR